MIGGWNLGPFVQGHDPMACWGRCKALPLGEAQPHGLPHGLRGGSLAQFGLEAIFAAATLLVQLLTPARDPHQGGLVAQVVEDGTADVLAGKGFKGLAPAWDVELGSAEQA